ncbi:MAG: InlB B-repeat-containing protein, partial [Candidatus Bathyarchaeota archaeon]|nr:InlB B-repeat-containing protein [Candidatus Termiticorpusculum sp.]
MNKNNLFKLNFSRNCLMIVSLMFALLLLTSPFVAIHAPQASGQTTWTVTLKTGDGTDENDRVYHVSDGTPLGVSGINLADPAARPGWLFIGWAPVLDTSEVVKSDLTYTAQWIADFTTPSPEIRHLWSSVLSSSAFGWTVPKGALNLIFNDVSRSGQTYLDYAYLTISEEGEASIYFLCLSRNGRIDSNTQLGYLGINAVLIKNMVYLDPINNESSEYSVWRVDLTESMVRTIINGGRLSGTFTLIMRSGGHSITGTTLSFTNVRVVVEHWIYVDNPADAVRFTTTPYTGTSGQVITAKPISIFGYDYDDVASQATKSGTVPSTGALELKLYYQKNSAYTWQIRSVLEGIGAETIYNGKQQSLSAFVDLQGLVDGKLFYIDWPNDPTDPNAEYIFLGSVELEDPTGVDVGIYMQDLRVKAGYQLLYKGSHHSSDATWVTSTGAPWKESDGLANKYEIITATMGEPASVPASLFILHADLTVITASASQNYDGTELTKTDDYTFTGLVNGETATFTVTGKQTTPGTSDNTYQITWDGTADPRNYAIAHENLGTLTVYAIISYEPNGGSGAMSSQIVSFNSPITLDANSFTKLGYTFTGWNTAADGTGQPYDDGDTFTYDIAGNLVLYAQWAQSVYTIIYDPGLYGNWLASEETYTGLVYGDPMPAYSDNRPTAGSIPDSRIVGWRINVWVDENSVEYDRKNLPKIVTGNMIYTATWIEDWYMYIYKPGNHGTWDPATETYTTLVFNDIKPEFASNGSGNDVLVDRDPGWTWYDWEFSTAVDMDGITIIKIYTALWRRDVYTVIYDPGTQGTWLASSETYHGLHYDDPVPA